MRSTTVITGTVALAKAVSTRALLRTRPVRSTSGPTIRPGVSQSDRIGMSKASQTWMKCAALSEAGLSMAPARNIGWLATTPTGRPAMRISDVTTARPKPALSSSTLPISAMPSITLRTL